MGNLNKNILAILLGLLASFFLLEGLLRIFQPIEFRVKGNKIILPAHKKYQFTNDKTDKLDPIIYTSRNPMGFRGEIPPPNFADYLTMITVGGSTTACEAISDGKTWCDLLGKQLRQSFQPFWLNNAGLDGTTTYGHLILMEDFIIKLRPKVVLFLVGANELGLSDLTKWDVKFLKKPVTGALAALQEKLVNGSEALSYAINFYRYAKARKRGLHHQTFDFANLKSSVVSQEHIQSLIQLARAQHLEPFAARLTRLIDICRENSIEPVFITQPMVFGDLIDPVTGTDLGSADTHALNGKTFWQLLEIYNDVTRATARRHGVELIDLGREMPKSSAYYYDTFHYSNAGCELVADILGRHLEPFLKKKYPQFSTVRPSGEQTSHLASPTRRHDRHSRLPAFSGPPCGPTLQESR
jgi:lysophospholipase L1-like esterase